MVAVVEIEQRSPTITGHMERPIIWVFFAKVEAPIGLRMLDDSTN
jgi:hypothetical protein